MSQVFGVKADNLDQHLLNRRPDLTYQSINIFHRCVYSDEGHTVLGLGAGLLAIAIASKVDEEVRRLNASVFVSRRVLHGSLNAVANCLLFSVGEVHNSSRF